MSWKNLFQIGIDQYHQHTQKYNYVIKNDSWVATKISIFYAW